MTLVAPAYNQQDVKQQLFSLMDCPECWVPVDRLDGSEALLRLLIHAGQVQVRGDTVRLRRILYQAMSRQLLRA